MTSASTINRVLLITILLATSTLAQALKKLTIDDLSNPSLMQAFATPTTWWLNDNTAYLIDTTRPDSLRALERLDPRSGKRSVVFRYTDGVDELRRLYGERTPPSLPKAPSSVSLDGRYCFYLIQDDIFLVDLRERRMHRVTTTPVKEKAVTFSPDGGKLAFVRNNDLFMYDIQTKQEKQLTTDGNDSTLNGTLSWVYWEEVFGRNDIGYWWSPDVQSLAYFHTDESGVSIQHYVDITPWTPTVTTQRYPKVGEKNPAVRVGIIDLKTLKTVWAAIDPQAYEYIVRVDWLPTSKQMCIRTLNRLQTELDFYLVDRATGASRYIMKDVNAGWINVSDDLHFMKDGKHFITASERNGYAHLYRFTLDGKLVNQITKGNWALSSSASVYWVRRAIAGVDESNHCIYFMALEKSSTERHLYRITLDGTELTRLTKQDGTHFISMSPDTRYYIDKFSNVSTPPSVTLHETNGERTVTIAPSSYAGLKEYEFATYELFSIPARDGFLLPASLLKPKELEPGKKYPVIVNVYGGPSAPTVANSFTYGLLWDNVLLASGFLVLKIDNRAATGISKDLENLLLYRTPGEVELNDLVDGVRWMKQQPFVDPERFGVYGWSGGGTNTILAMTRSQEFKAGIAGAGVTDFRLYDTKWAEAMMKTEKENKEGYEAVSLMKFAKNLHGKLMLIHGTHDDNVHVQNTYQFIQELIRADKLFELVIYPMRGHGFRDAAGRHHLNRTMLDFWKRNL